MVAPNAVAENVLGTIGAILWSFQVTPQIWKSYRRKDTTGLSARMLAIWFCSSIFLGGYVITQDLAVPLLLQPQLFGFFIAISWGQCLVYSFGKTQRYATCAVAFVCLAAGAIEVGLVYGARAAEARGYEQPTQTYGILSAVLIVVGIFPQYYEIYELKAVMGISMIFLFVDMGGAFFSTLSLIFTPGSFDITACASYACAFFLELGIFGLAAVLNPRHRRRLAEEQEKAARELEGSGEVGEEGVTGREMGEVERIKTEERAVVGS